MAGAERTGAARDGAEATARDGDRNFDRAGGGGNQGGRADATQTDAQVSDAREEGVEPRHET